MLLGSVALFLAAILIAGFLPSLAMAQQTAPPITTTTIPPLTPEEQEEQNRLQSVIAATNQNLDETEKEVNGIVYTPRWSNPVWIEANSLSILFAYCLPGEFAESGQEILGGFELEVLESYEIALPQNFMAWTMVIGNEDRQDRLPAAVGVICASDTNDVETRVLSPQEQQEINNVVQQFTTQVTNIEQVINIINNVTTNGTGTTTPPLPGGGTTPGGPITASLSANPATHQGPCPVTIQFSGTITDNVGNRDVAYRFIFSDGATQAMPAIHFDQPGSQSVSTTWTLGDINALPSYQGWAAIEILQPVQLQSNRAEFQITCTPTTGGAPPVGSSSTSGGGITVSANPFVLNGVACPSSPLGFAGTITDNVGNRDVTFRFIWSTGAITPPQTIHFDQPGSQTVSYTSPGIAPPGLEGWVAIEILQPVQLQSNQAEMEITCTAPSTGGAPQTLQAEEQPPVDEEEEAPPVEEQPPVDEEEEAPPAEEPATEEEEAATSPPVDDEG